MNRAEIVKKICEKSNYNLSQKCANEVLSILFEEIEKAVSKGDSVQFVGFGTFSSAKRSARTMISPATHKKISVPSKKVPKFKAGAAFKDLVAGKAKAAAKKPAKGKKK